MEPAITYWPDDLPALQSDDPWEPNQAPGTPIKSVSSPDIARDYPLNFAMVSKGRELTRKNGRLPSNLVPFDRLIGGGLPRGRISEFVGGVTSGKTSAATAFAAAASRIGETVAWIDSTNSFDPASQTATGIDLSRLLWVNPANLSSDFANQSWRDRRDALKRVLRTSELILDTGGFALAIIDLCINSYPLAHSTALRLARIAERSGTSVLILAQRRICGTFAALSLSCSCLDAEFDNSYFASHFPRSSIVIPALLDRLTIRTRITHNKMNDGAVLGSDVNWNAVSNVSDHDASDRSSAISTPASPIAIPLSTRVSATSR